MTVADVLAAIERVAPATYAYPEDRIGLQVGSSATEVRKVVTTLDRSLAAVRFAKERCAQMLLAHHPLIWEPLSSVREDDHVGQTVTELIKGGIAFAAAHTNWDAAHGGVNDVLCEILGLEDVKPFGIATPQERLHLVTYVPEANLQGLIDALSQAGAGVIGLYRRCAFFGPGTGTYIPMPGADPTFGVIGSVEETTEVRLEMMVPEDKVEAVSAALSASHPYDEPAFHFHRLLAGEGLGLGRVGTLNQPASLRELSKRVDGLLDTRCLTWGLGEEHVRTVAVVGGSGSSMWADAKRSGADVLLTGEAAQHHAVEASESGLGIIQAGHYATENPGAKRLGERLAKELPEIEVIHFEPEPGTAGRPF